MLLYLSAGSVLNSVPDKAVAVLKQPREIVEKALQKSNIPFQVISETEGITQLVVQGKAAHAAFPEGSIHAQKQLAQLLCTSDLLDSETTQVLWGVTTFLEDNYGGGLGIAYATPEFGKLTMVSGMTKLEDGHLTMAFDIRYPVGFNSEQAKERIVKGLGEFGFTLESWTDSPGYYRDPNLPVIQQMKAVAERVWGREFPLYVMGGSTYARRIPNAVPFGPGLPRYQKERDEGRGQCHQPDEEIQLEVLQKGIEIYVEVLPILDTIVD